MTYAEAIEYITHASTFGIQLGLVRIQELLRRLGNPQERYKTIHVTGTNGKGSVSAIVAQSLQAAGIKTGRYTSPHLEEYTERISVDGTDISRGDFAAAIAVVAQAVDAMAAAGMERPTEFELLTAAAFWHFANCHVEYAVIEVGLGGLLDSTNVITPVVSVITNVALDHMKYCGPTVEAIAVHKAGILKEGVPAVTAASGPALAVISAAAEKHHCPLAVLHRDFDFADRHCQGLAGQSFTIQRQGAAPLSVTMPLLGFHQAQNAAVAVMALTSAAAQDRRITDESILQGLAQVRWPGRFQVVRAGDVPVVIDGAHNPAGIATFCQTYEENFGTAGRVFLFSVLADKDYSQMVRQLFHDDDFVICAPAPTPRTSDPQKLAAMLPCRAAWTNSIDEGLDQAFQAVQPGQVLCIVGSLYIQGDVRRYFKRKGIAV
jgi:dihydrofolate synthase/folylpolyglutamate synthase